MALMSLRGSLAWVRRRSWRWYAGRGTMYILLFLMSLVFTIPFIWLVSSSLKPPAQIWVYPPQWIPNPVRLENYPEALSKINFLQLAANTIFVSCAFTFGVVSASSFCAYGFAKLRFPGRDLIFMVLLSTTMLPGIVLMIPQFIMFKYLGWIDTFNPLIVPVYFGGGAFNIFLLRQFFLTIPEELSDAARIDGCSEFGIYGRIILPLAKPALATVGIFAFLFSWNDFMGPLIYINSEAKKTIALGLGGFINVYKTEWHWLMAASVVMTLPTILLFFVAQRYFIQGIVLTGMKG